MVKKKQRITKKAIDQLEEIPVEELDLEMVDEGESSVEAHVDEEVKGGYTKESWDEMVDGAGEVDTNWVGGVDPVSEVTVKEPPQFTNPVEVYEKKVYWIKAKNRQDVDAALKMLLASQDEVESIKPLKGITYEVEVLAFRLRDGF